MPLALGAPPGAGVSRAFRCLYVSVNRDMRRALLCVNVLRLSCLGGKMKNLDLEQEEYELDTIFITAF